MSENTKPDLGLLLDLIVKEKRVSKHYHWEIEPLKIRTWGGIQWGEVTRILAEVTQDGEIYVQTYGYRMVKDGSRRRSGAAYTRLIEREDDIEKWVEERV